MTDTPRERLLAEVATMTDEQIEQLIRYIESISPNDLPPDYDPAKDPFITGEAFFDGPPDLAERTEEILQAGFGMPKTEDD
jgi:hypothetical protein